jgi:SNF2 family DNA or RNA helicase
MPSNFTPRPYQTIGTKFLIDTHRCNLWAQPGMGKTSIALSAVDILKMAGSSFFPVLVLAPLRVADLVWQREIEKWAEFEGLTLTKILGDQKGRAAALKRAPVTDLYVCNYDNIPWLTAQFASREWPFKTVISDEATRLKGFRLSHSTVRTRELAKVAKHTGRWINMTGSPTPNGLVDLWGQQWFVDFGQRLGRTFTQFVQRWFHENEYSHSVTPLPGADKEIYAALSDCTLALRAEDWFDLQRPVLARTEVALPASARSLYAEMERKFFLEFDNTDIEAGTAAIRSSKLLQIASGSVYDSDSEWHDIHDAKLEALENIVEEFNEPLLVACHWQFTYDRIKRLYPKARTLKTQRDQDDWNAGKVQLMMVPYKSASHGIDLQFGGRGLVYFDQIWDLELIEQVLERLGPTRQKQAGFSRNVLVWDLVARDTMDEQARDRVDDKSSVQSALMKARARRQ